MPKGARSAGREAALMMLYALDQRMRTPDDYQAIEEGDVEQLIADYWRELPGPSEHMRTPEEAEGRPFADELVRGAAAELKALDDRIRSASKHWRLERMGRVDRNVLRLGTYELARDENAPRAVIIDEAVELAKRYGAEGSAVFVNGVLDRIAEDLGRR